MIGSLEITTKEEYSRKYSEEDWHSMYLGNRKPRNTVSVIADLNIESYASKISSIYVAHLRADNLPW